MYRPLLKSIFNNKKIDNLVREPYKKVFFLRSSKSLACCYSYYKGLYLSRRQYN